MVRERSGINMSDKELAVQLYIAHLQTKATIDSHPKFGVNQFAFPSYENMIEGIEYLTKRLKDIN